MDDSILSVLDWVQQARTIQDEAVITLPLGKLREQILLTPPPPGHPLWFELLADIEARDSQLMSDPAAQTNLRLWSALLKALAWQAQNDTEGYIEELELALEFADATTRAKSLHDMYNRIVNVIEGAIRVALLNP